MIEAIAFSMDSELMQIRLEQPADRAGIAEILVAAFGREAEAQLVDRIRASNYPWLGMVAYQPDAIVGYVLLSAVDCIGERSSQLVWALAPLAVHPDYQRRGIGTALVQAALEQAAATDYPLVVVLGHADFYARCGFEPAADHDIVAPFPVPSPVFRIKQLPAYSPQPGAIAYPTAFSGL